MKTISDDKERKALNKLQTLINKKLIKPTEAWSCFSKPKSEHEFKNHTVNLNENEIKSLNEVRQKVKKIIKQKISKRCAYCKRAMGQHGMSWNIEHIRCKSKHPRMTFILSNLTYACLDCNLVKNNAVDNKRNYIFDIIDPNSKGFRYGENIGFLQLSTDSIHVLKYKPISKAGNKTYEKLRFRELEHIELLSSLNDTIGSLCERIDERLSYLASSDDTLELAVFLQNMKFKLG
ncbi:HNH endonuclease [Pseudomonas siliginis]|uniref:HNH endonuclease n=1 Tax=Pseudomonas siliginis TaxID=2842346 RepID=UPI00386E0364